MELKLEQGAYVPSGGGLASVSGGEEIAQRVVMRLTARRGGFAPLPDYGSRLYLLPRTALPSEWKTEAMQSVAEALSEEPDVTVTDVEVTPVAADCLRIDVTFTAQGTQFTAGVQV